MVLEFVQPHSDRPCVVIWDSKGAKLVHSDGNSFFDSDTETLQSSSESNDKEVLVPVNERKYLDVEDEFLLVLVKI